VCARTYRERLGYVRRERQFEHVEGAMWGVSLCVCMESLCGMRFKATLDALEECDRAFEQDAWTRFREAAKEVHRLMNGGKGR